MPWVAITINNVTVFGNMHLNYQNDHLNYEFRCIPAKTRQVYMSNFIYLLTNDILEDIYTCPNIIKHLLINMFVNCRQVLCCYDNYF